MIRSPAPLCAALVLAVMAAPARAQGDWHMVYTPSHRATFEQTWAYTFPEARQVGRWIIALRYPPELAWSRDAVGKAELRTSAGWTPFKEVREGSKERRRMLGIDVAHQDPKLQRGFTIRTALTATICDQALLPGKPAEPVKPLAAEERAAYLAATRTFDFHAADVRRWMDEHKMWRGEGEDTVDFVRRVYRELRRTLPYDVKDGGAWTCSQIVKVGYGECCRHAIVGTSILRANRVPARAVCALWAVDDKSQGAHCWGEFFLDGAGWVPYDTTLDSGRPNTDDYFGRKKGEHLAGMIDFDWVIEAGPFGRPTVLAIDSFPAFWGQGTGNLANPKCDTTTRVRVHRRFQ